MRVPRAVVASITMAALGGLGVAAHQPPPQDSIVVRDAWVRQTSVTRTVSSGYLQIDNRTSAPIALVKVVVDGVRNTQVHRVAEENGRTAMTPVARLVIPQHSSVTLEPGGTHLMLTDVVRPLRAESTIRMILTFDNRQTRAVRAVVRPLDATSAR